VNRVPYVLGYFYDLMDRPPSPQKKSDRLRRLAEKLNLRKFLKFLRSEPWDAVVNTHFLPAEMVAQLKRKQEFTAPQLTVTTDFETHRLWVNQPCERYFTATAEGAAYLAHWGVPRDTIEVAGIPIHPAFSR
jgi:processive 1,2-diacylglycerol beta-glucosyltransferase